MKYSDFIEEIRILFDGASTLFDKEEIDRDPAFRKWRHKLTAAIDAIKNQGYVIKCNVKRRRFTIGGYSHKSDRIKRYNQDIQDTINELETIIKYFDNYGDPVGSTIPDISIEPKPEIEYPQKVTLSWLAEHAPIGLWLKFAGILVTAFILGLGFSQTVAYKNMQNLWQEEISTDSRNKEPNQAHQKTPRSSATEL